MDTLQEYKCPCCDGTISFDADSQIPLNSVPNAEISLITTILYYKRNLRQKDSGRKIPLSVFFYFFVKIIFLSHLSLIKFIKCC